MRNLRPRSYARGAGFVSLGLVLLVGMWPVFSGCNGEAESGAVLTPQNATGAGQASPPTLVELKTAVGLSDDQAKLIEPALARWRERAEAMTPSGPRKGRGPRLGGTGARQGRGAHLQDFLEECGGLLETEAFVDLVDFLAERRDARRAQRTGLREGCPEGGRGRFGPGGRGGRLHGAMAEGPALEEAQKKALRDAVRTAHEALRDAHRGYRDGDLNAGEVRDRAQAAVDRLRESLPEILTQDQVDGLVTAMRERTQKMVERRLEHLDEGPPGRMTFLVKVLKLDDSQQEALERTHAEFRPRRKEILTGIAEGNVSFVEALYSELTLSEERHRSVRALLTEEQQERFQALRKLGRGPRPFPIYL
jgi:hypothetical protein